MTNYPVPYGSTTPAGWYPDPQNAGVQRYWSGTAWTDHVAPLVSSAPVPYGYNNSVAVTDNRRAKTGMVCGIVGICVVWIPFGIGLIAGFVLAVLGIIFGGIGISTANKLGGLNKNQAVTGLVLGIVTICLMFVGVGTFF